MRDGSPVAAILLILAIENNLQLRNFYVMLPKWYSYHDYHKYYEQQEYYEYIEVF